MENKRLMAIGEALIDFIPNKTGCDFEDVTAFAPKVGGAPANVCGAFVRLGGQASIITQLGDDPFGRKILHEFAAYGIDTSRVQQTTQANTALAFVSLAQDGNRTFSFYRKPSADMLLGADAIEEAWFSDVYALHFCSVSLGDFPMREAHDRAIAYAGKHRAIVSFDPNLRFPLWDDLVKLKERVQAYIPYCDVLKISDEELSFITGEEEIERALPGLLQQGVKLVLYTCGSRGAYAFTANATAFAPSHRVQAVDTTGAGDGFIGAFLRMLQEKQVTADTLSGLDAQSLTECLAFSNEFCARSVQKEGAIASYPTRQEMEQGGC